MRLALACCMQKALLCGVIGIGLSLGVSPVDACVTPEPPSSLQGYPEDGASDVPTDVLPIYQASAAGVPYDPNRPYNLEALERPGTFSLRTAEGEEVALAPQPSHYWWFELAPAAPLRPHTRYVLEVSPASSVGDGSSLEPLRLSFTTGSGPVSELPPAPSAQVQQWQFAKDVPLNSCQLV